MSIISLNRGASKRRLEVLSIRVAIKLCLYSGLKMDRASRAFSVETVDGDNRGLKIGRVSSCLLFLKCLIAGYPLHPRRFVSDLAPYLQFAKTGRCQRYDAAQLLT